jgi:hypothetical protein
VSFLGNDAINRVNLHTTLVAMAQGSGGVFVFVFLLRAGVPIPLVLCTLAAMTAGRFMMRPAVLIAARRWGLRATLMAGTIMEAGIFPLLPHVHGPDAALMAVIAVSALGSVFYWTSLHAYTALLGDADARGRQIGVRAAAAALMNIVAPWVGGWALTALGPEATFGAVTVAQLTGLLPLIGAPSPRVAERAPIDRRAARLAILVQAGDGLFSAGFYYVWQIALFVSLGERFANYGGAMALAGLAGAVASLAIGRVVDLGHGRATVMVAYGVCTAVTALKAASLGAPALAVLANALATVALLLLEPVMMSPVYNLAKASACPLRFCMATEGGWDVGCTAGCLAAAGLTALRIPLPASILLALPGSAIGFALLLRSYGARRLSLAAGS